MQDISVVVSNQLKELYNIAYVRIENKEYEKAASIFMEAGSLCELLRYSQGKAMAWMSLANLFLLTDQFTEAMYYAIKAEECCEEANIEIEMNPRDFLERISNILLKKGIELEKKEEMLGAYEIYQKILPYLKGKKKLAVEQEMKLMEELNGVTYGSENKGNSTS